MRGCHASTSDRRGHAVRARRPSPGDYFDRCRAPPAAGVDPSAAAGHRHGRHGRPHRRGAPRARHGLAGDRDRLLGDADRDRGAARGPSGLRAAGRRRARRARAHADRHNCPRRCRAPRRPRDHRGQRVDSRVRRARLGPKERGVLVPDRRRRRAARSPRRRRCRRRAGRRGAHAVAPLRQLDQPLRRGLAPLGRLAGRGRAAARARPRRPRLRRPVPARPLRRPHDPRRRRRLHLAQGRHQRDERRLDDGAYLRTGAARIPRCDPRRAPDHPAARDLADLLPDRRGPTGSDRAERVRQVRRPGPPARGDAQRVDRQAPAGARRRDRRGASARAATASCTSSTASSSSARPTPTCSRTTSTRSRRATPCSPIASPPPSSARAGRSPRSCARPD